MNLSLNGTPQLSLSDDAASSASQVNGYPDVNSPVNTPERGTEPQTRRPSFKMVTAAVIWLAMVVTVTLLMIAYANSPGRSGTPPTAWPVKSQIPLQAGVPTFVMFAHPRCPCTRASLGELERLMARSSGQLAAHLLFIKPAGTEKDWAQTDLWRKASAIPGVTVHQDEAGVEARRFNSETSGQSVLYDAGGRLLFHGGITLSRGHAGDNPGRSAIETLLREPRSSRVTTPVFGCSLFETDGQEGGAECSKPK